jgi:hypothetical protein
MSGVWSLRCKMNFKGSEEEEDQQKGNRVVHTAAIFSAENNSHPMIADLPYPLSLSIFSTLVPCCC